MFVTANIFIQYNPLIYQSPESGIEDDSSDSELNDKITYKIGTYSKRTTMVRLQNASQGAEKAHNSENPDWYKNDESYNEAKTQDKDG